MIWPVEQMGRLSPEVRKLYQVRVPPGVGADLSATKHGGLARLEPLTAHGRRWLSAIVTEETSWDGDALVLELRYFPNIAEAAIDAGLTFERHALIN
ncbi:MAG: hypothetical protein ACTHKR_09100 [Sphingomonas sp.]